jgi:hypothetical protein
LLIEPVAPSDDKDALFPGQLDRVIEERKEDGFGDYRTSDPKKAASGPPPLAAAPTGPFFQDS